MPDFSVKPKIQSTIKSIADTNLNRINARYNELFGRPFVGETNVFDILNEVESRRKSQSFGYSEQKGIGQRPRLNYTGEGLKQYSLSITLHHSYCRPDYIIQQLEEKAASGESFSYYQGSKYIGEYVISNVEVNTIDEYQNVTLCAEVSIELLESVDDVENEEFEQQTKKTVEITEDKIKSVSVVPPPTPVDMVLSRTENIFDTITEDVIDKTLRNAESYINSTIGGVTGDIL